MTINPLNGTTAPQNIFSSPLQKNQQGKELIAKKNQNKGKIYLIVALVFIIPYSVMFLYPQTSKFLGFQSELTGLQAEIKDYENILADLAEKRELHKAAYDKEFEAEQKVMEVVFPKEPEKLAIIQLLENFATRLSTAYPPFEFTSITFQEATQKNGVTVLPFQTTIHASRKNFDRFLALVDLSGNYNPESQDHIRLMEISNISLRYRGPDTNGKDQGVDFTVELNAYSQAAAQ